MWELELKMSIGQQIVECLLEINGHRRGPGAEFGERNKALQNNRETLPCEHVAFLAI